MNNTINSLKDALLTAISIAENEDMPQEDKNSALNAVQEDYENYLQNSLMIFQPSQYGLHGFSQEQLNFITSIKLVRPSAESLQAYLRTFAESDVAMANALAGLATDMGFSVAGIDRRANSAKLADFSAIITQLKTGETDDALALLEQVTDVNNITVTVE